MYNALTPVAGKYMKKLSLAGVLAFESNLTWSQEVYKMREGHFIIVVKITPDAGSTENDYNMYFVYTALSKKAVRRQTTKISRWIEQLSRLENITRIPATFDSRCNAYQQEGQAEG